MGNRTFVITVLALVALSVYLFISAPAPLPEQQRRAGVTLPIGQVFRIVEAENDAVRGLWTRDIVGAGKKVGLKFAEDWRERGVEAGPLPALFLRETAASLEKNPVQLSLYLGSDYPISAANLFKGVQLEKFRQIRASGEPQFFYDEDIQRHAAMFDDVALARPCVTCHNDHPDSPKQDWRLNDVMGATTWSYPQQAVDLEELLAILAALRNGFRDAYSAYLEKVATFAAPPEIGERWPGEGFYLPTVEAFMAEAGRRTSAQTLAAVMALAASAGEGAAEPAAGDAPAAAAAVTVTLRGTAPTLADGR